MRELNPTKCQERIYPYSGLLPYQCPKKTTVTRDGKLYCTIHDPEYIKKKQEKRQTKYDAEYAERQRRWALETARIHATVGLTLEELNQVTPSKIRQMLNS